MSTAILLLLVSLFLMLIRLNYQSLLFFQQNRYEFSRYIRWIRFNLFRYIDKSFYLVCVVVIIFRLLHLPLIFTALVILVYATYTFWKWRQTKYIKPLVFTRRVKTQYFVLLFLECFLLVIFVGNGLFYYSELVVGMELLIYFVVLVMHGITLPIEKMIANSYLNQAKNILRSSPATIIGITGSYGKTSTKHAIMSVLSESFYSYMTPASYNTPMGITRCVREELKSIHQVFICEMGADKVGDITELMNFVQPKLTVVTSIGPQHLQTFKTLDNIIQEKMKAVELLDEDGDAIINIDNEYIANYKLKNKCRLHTISLTNPKADYFADKISSDKDGSKFVVRLRGKDYPFQTKLIGKHNISNCLVAIAIADILNMNPEYIQDGVAKQNYVPHRLELKTINGFQFIDNAFNSNPVSSKLSVDTICTMPYKRIVVTPGFIDLGQQEDEYNYQFGLYLADKVDEVYLIGTFKTRKIVEALKTINKATFKVFDNIQDAFRYIYQTQDPKECIILLENDLPDAFNK